VLYLHKVSRKTACWESPSVSSPAYLLLKLLKSISIEGGTKFPKE